MLKYIQRKINFYASAAFPISTYFNTLMVQADLDPQGNIGYNQHILHNPGDHNIPTSPQNCLMYYITKESSSAPALLVRRYLSLDQKTIKIEMEEVQQEPIIR